eukprot:TRINITY_DN10118_c0_g1_i1.p1 TRINITY_DN10118_c0_g1~~TRINITY_DN10118_c0_g1_i1.p1  ORF type:complete len:202 (+),score=22.71 TRINITY_DN10118_c0_g1_i1:25-606(+)
MTREVMGALPMGTDAFSNRRTNYHITLFHTSRPDDPRPDALQPSGGVERSVPGPERPAPTEDALKAELAVCESIAADTSTAVVQFERVFLADTGSLVMAWSDAGGLVEKLRSKYIAKFPGAPSKQAGIIHTTLMRILTPSSIDEHVRSDIMRICDKWTKKLAGRTWTPENVWLVYETEFSTIEGERHVMPLAT